MHRGFIWRFVLITFYLYSYVHNVFVYAERCSPDEHLDFTVPESSLPDDVPICAVPSSVSHGLPQLERDWESVIAYLKDDQGGETELMGIIEDFDGLVDDDRKTSSLSVIGRRIAYSLKQVCH